MKNRFYQKRELHPSLKEEFDTVLNIVNENNHIHMIAGSGKGKSELMKLMLIRLAQANNQNLVLFDMDGDVSNEFAKLFNEETDVVFIDPTLKYGKTPTINPMQYKRTGNLQLDMETDSIVVQELIYAFESILGTDFSTNMEVILTHILYVLVAKGDSGVDEIVRFLDDDDNEDLIALGRKSHIKAHRDFFMNQFSKSKYSVSKEALVPKLLLLLQHPLFSNLITGRSTIDLEKIINTKGSVLIFRLPIDKMKKVLAPISKLIMASIQGVIQRRANISKDLRVKTTLFLDEFQYFTNKSINEMLSESRKHNSSIVCAHQYLYKLDNDTKNAVHSNTNVKIVGNNSNQDLKEMSSEIDVDVALLKELKKGEFFIKYGTNEAIKILTTSDYLDNKASVKQGLWNYHIDYQIRHYYKDVANGIEVEDTTPNRVEQSSTQEGFVLPTPKYDTEE